MNQPITSQSFGQTVQDARKKLKLRQRDVAFACGTGIRFIVDLEKGKETCQLGKVLRVCQMLGIRIILQNLADLHEK